MRWVEEEFCDAVGRALDGGCTSNRRGVAQYFPRHLEINRTLRGVGHDGIDNPAGHRGADVNWRGSDVAAQPGVGLWSVRRARHSSADLGRVGLARPHLKCGAANRAFSKPWKFAA